METGWEIHFGLGTETEMTAAPAKFAGATPAYKYGIPTAESLRIDDLLDFPSSSSSSSDEPALLIPAGGQEFSSAAAAAAAGGGGAPFANDIYIPSEEAAELEWLSKFMEDSFSDAPHHYSPAETKMATENRNFPASEISPHGLAGSINGSPEISTSYSSSSSSSSSDFPKGVISKKKQGNNGGGGARRCTHCCSEKTPQWRTGPLGPKTLCNACGVRFKSGRLVPEYRPAASPTFVLAQHSNSHRKVMELRRQKEFLVLRGGGGGGGGGGRSPALLFEDYEAC